MGLRPKFNIVLFVVFATGFASVWVITERFLMKRMLEEVEKTAYSVMETLASIPDNATDISSLVRISRIKATFQTLDYRTVQIDPEKVTPLPAGVPDLAAYFSANPAQGETSGESGIKDARRYYFARALRSDTNKLTAVRLVTIGLPFYVHEAERALYTLMGSLLTIFVVVFLLLNMLLDRMIVRPITQIARTADEISIGNLDIPEIRVESKDEIATLVTAFNRLRRSTEEAIRMLSK
jgi:methyl-accepting chemotaxis protein